MATSQKTVSLNNDGEQLKDVLPKELTEKLKDSINAHAKSELRERLDALKKATGFDSLNQITALREQFDAMNKTRSQHSISLGALKDTQNKIAAIKEQYETLHKTRSQLNVSLGALKDTQNKIAAMKEQFETLHKTSALSIALDDLKKATGLDSRNKIAAIIEQQNTLKVASKTLLSFNLFPMKSFESSLKNINYPTSINHALARDWQNVGNDLWKSYLKVSGNQLSDNDE